MEGLNQKQGSRPEQMPGYYYQPPQTQYAHTYTPQGMVPPQYIAPSVIVKTTRKDRKLWEKQQKMQKKQYKKFEQQQAVEQAKAHWNSLSFTKKCVICVIGFFFACFLISSIAGGCQDNTTGTSPVSDTSTARVADNPRAPEHWFD